MGTEAGREWISDLADMLVCAVMEKMAGIRLEDRRGGPPGQLEMGAVSCQVYTGAVTRTLRFRAEPGLFRRLTESILGGPPEQEEDIWEFAEEYINTLGGRFVAELCYMTGQQVRLTPPRYEGLSGEPDGPPGRWKTRRYISDRQELAEFSWSVDLENMFGGTREMKHRVMVVDDSRVIHMEMQRMLDDSEFEIAAFFRSGEAALEGYEETAPDVVTMDIVMPGMDGFETTKELLEKWPEARVIMVSSLAYDATKEGSAELGARGFIYKPFTRDSLLEGLRKALED